MGRCSSDNDSSMKKAMLCTDSITAAYRKKRYEPIFPDTGAESVASPTMRRSTAGRTKAMNTNDMVLSPEVPLKKSIVTPVNAASNNKAPGATDTGRAITNNGYTKMLSKPVTSMLSKSNSCNNTVTMNNTI